MIEEQTSVRDWGSVLRFSKTNMQTFLMCPRKFYFQYVTGMPWEFVPASLPFGKALHQAVASYYLALKQGATPELGAIIEEFSSIWKGETTNREIRFSSSNAASMEGLGKALLERFFEEVRPRRVQAVEYPFCIDILDPDGGGVLEHKLVGIIDLIEADDEGNLIISELKTSAKRFADSQGEGQLDGLVYAYALDQLGFRTTTERTLIRYDVLVKTKQPAFQQVYFNKEPGDYRRLGRWIKEVLEAIDHGAFFPNFGWGCKQCQFRRACWNL
jgi:CRISPR/Cas system-associated exonuclease Cas4 (RecB family)